MTKVLSNLRITAFKFSDPERGMVWLSLASEPAQVLITVRDNGIGIPQDQLDRIFDRFTQVEGQTTRRFEGSGIGLALAKEIVTLHGGQIAVQSVVDEGSTFTITLPRGEVASQPLTSLDEEDTVVPLESEGIRPSVEEGATIRDAAIGDQPLILIADDNADMRAYLVRLLADEYRVISAHDGADALEKTRRVAPSLVVADIMMPVMSGHDLLKAIRSDEFLRTIPVILLTARAGTEARVESLEAGADDYVSKPFNEEELLARIKNQLRIHRQEQELETKAAQLQDLYSKLEGTNAVLREVSLRKSEFVSIVSHDLRTPLAAIAGFVENLMDEIAGPLTDKQRRYLDRIKNNIGRLVRMINDLLDLSKIEAGTMRLELKPFAIAELVETVADNLQGLAQEKGISLCAISADKNLMVLGDPDKLTQVLTNLVQNACKFTLAGGEVRLEVTTDEPGFAGVCVADTGCGIPLEEAARVFDKFYRGTASHGEARGVGLGLAISKHLVELHQGRIGVESTPGQGSRFCFTIPLATPEGGQK